MDRAIRRNPETALLSNPYIINCVLLNPAPKLNLHYIPNTKSISGFRAEKLAVRAITGLNSIRWYSNNCVAVARMVRPHQDY